MNTPQKAVSIHDFWPAYEPSASDFFPRGVVVIPRANEYPPDDIGIVLAARAATISDGLQAAHELICTMVLCQKILNAGGIKMTLEAPPL